MSRPAAISFGEGVWETVVMDRRGNRRAYRSRGPRNVEEARASINYMLLMQRVRAVRSGAEDPNPTIVSVLCLGDNEGPLGTFLPPNARTVDLNLYATKSAEKADPFADLF